MDYDVKAALFRVCQILRDLEDRVYYAERMGWQTYMAANQLVPNFAPVAEAHEGVSFEGFDKAHDEMHRALDQMLDLFRATH